MTFRVYFYAEQAFLSFVKKSISIEHNNIDDEIESGAVCVFACAAALEATVNSMLKNDGRMLHFDELKLTSKIETIASFSGDKIDWGVQPWQEISKLIRLRNWLAHYKDSDIGLINGDGEWIVDSVNVRPKIDPERELSKISVSKYYDATRKCLKILAALQNADTYLYDFLDAENYQPILMG